MKLKILAIILAFLLVLNLVLYSLRLTNDMVFWSIIIIVAVLAYLFFRGKK